MVPIVFGADLINIHEWAGLRVNFFKCRYLRNRMSDFDETWFGGIGRRCSICMGDMTSHLINIHEGRGQT